MSRRYGLLPGPVLVNPNGATGAPVLAAAELPAPLAASAYGPLRLFATQPGDELGYVQEPFSYGLPCERSHILRRVLTRQLTADSLVFTFLEQQQRQSFGVPGCSAPAGTALLPARRGRRAVALRTGHSRQYEALPLLSGGYQSYAGPGAGWLPTRAAQAAAAFAVFPNLAGAAATVALTAPAQPGTRLTLRDALARPVWEAALAPGQARPAPPGRWPGRPPACT